MRAASFFILLAAAACSRSEPSSSSQPPRSAASPAVAGAAAAAFQPSLFPCAPHDVGFCFRDTTVDPEEDGTMTGSHAQWIIFGASGDSLELALTPEMDATDMTDADVSLAGAGRTWHDQPRDQPRDQPHDAPGPRSIHAKLPAGGAYVVHVDASSDEDAVRYSARVNSVTNAPSTRPSGGWAHLRLVAEKNARLAIVPAGVAARFATADYDAWRVESGHNIVLLTSDSLYQICRLPCSTPKTIVLTNGAVETDTLRSATPPAAALSTIAPALSTDGLNEYLGDGFALALPTDAVVTHAPRAATGIHDEIRGPIIMARMDAGEGGPPDFVGSSLYAFSIDVRTLSRGTSVRDWADSLGERADTVTIAGQAAFHTSEVGGDGGSDTYCLARGVRVVCLTYEMDSGFPLIWQKVRTNMLIFSTFRWIGDGASPQARTSAGSPSSAALARVTGDGFSLDAPAPLSITKHVGAHGEPVITVAAHPDTVAAQYSLRDTAKVSDFRPLFAFDVTTFNKPSARPLLAWVDSISAAGTRAGRPDAPRAIVIAGEQAFELRSPCDHCTRTTVFLANGEHVVRISYDIGDRESLGAVKGALYAEILSTFRWSQ